MKILVIGSGGREHALVWKIAQSKQVKKIFCAPGNAGIAQIAECIDIKADDIDKLAEFAEKEKIDLTVVGPEAALVKGIVDLFEAKDLKIFGPRQKAAQLEASKVFAKEFMFRHKIPTADFRIFDDPVEAKKYIAKIGAPCVVKADGLAAGKGVIVAKSIDQANAAVEEIMQQKIFGASGNKIVIEECLEGQEVSILVVTDADASVMLASSQDHKRIFDNDQGPNTGGMGAYSPAPIATEELLNKIGKEIVYPTICGLNKEDIIYKGIIYFGVMVTKEGPKVLEYNVRFGDPETQAILPRLNSDLVGLMLSVVDNRLLRFAPLKWDSGSAVCVVCAAKGYPGEYEKGREIKGLDQAAKIKNAVVFHAGTKNQSGKIITSGGRVLGVTALGGTIKEAIANAYSTVEKISFEGMQYRKDIGRKAL